MRLSTTLAAIAVSGTLISCPVFAQADNTNSRTAPSMNTWMKDYSTKNHGYISRQAYMDEMGRRWDMMDTQHRGLTTDQINGMYSMPDPTHVNPGSPATNVMGTERKGQNSGGK